MRQLAREDEREELEEVLGPAEPLEPLEWVPVVASLGVERKRVRLRSGGERVYEGYRVRVPREAVERLGLQDGGTVLMLLARPRWYHLLDYREEPLRSRFREMRRPWVKAEICLMGGAREEDCRDYRIVPVIAGEDELKALGLEPGRPVTLRELVERLREKTRPGRE